jgi:hypothetical protein
MFWDESTHTMFWILPYLNYDGEYLRMGAHIMMWQFVLRTVDGWPE